MRTRIVRGDCRCTALVGTVDVAVRCTIYDRRPEVCREYERGGSDCRAMLGGGK